MIIDQLFTQPVFESQTDPITQFASNAHEEWRRNFDPTGTKPRIKKNSDGTEGDINVPFEKLHPDWKKENLAAGHAAHHAVKHFGRDMEKAAEHVHNEWMKRNPKADYNAAQHVPYDDLSDDEKEKDRVHVRTMMRLMGHHPKQGVAEVAPPGAKAERMVKHIKQGYAKDGKLTPKEKGIAFATAWKAHNAGQVEEGEITKNATGLKHRATDKYGAGDDEPHHYTGGRSGFSEPGKYARDLEHVNKQLVKDLDASMGISWKNRGTKGIEVDEQGVAEGEQDPQSELKLINQKLKDAYKQVRNNSSNSSASIGWYMSQVKALNARREELIKQLRQGVAEGETSTPAIYVKGGGKYPGMTIAPKGWSRIRDIKDEGDAYFVMVGNDGDGLNIPKDKVSLHRIKLKNGMPITAKQAFMMLNGRTPDREQGVVEGYTGRETKAGTWRVFKDGNAVAAAGPFKSADEAAAWIKKHKQGITEMDKSEPSAGRDGGPRPGPDREAKPITAKKATKDMGDMLTRVVKDSHKKKDVKESDPLMLKLRRALIKEGRVKELADDLKTMNDTDFMKKYGKAKAAIRKDMTELDEARTDYTPDEMADMLSGKRSQKQIDADAERTRGPNKAPPTKESTQSRAKRLNEKMSTSDTLSRPAAGASSSGKAIDDPDIMGSLKGASTPKFDRFSKTGGEPEFDFRTGLGDNETEIETDPRLAAEPNKYMQSWGGKFATQGAGGEDPRFTAPAGWRYVEKDEDPARYGSAAAAAASGGGLPNLKYDPQSRSVKPADALALDQSPKSKYKFDRTTQSQVPADRSGANPNIDDATRDHARAWAAQQNAPGAALAGAMRSSGNPVDTAKKKTDWKTIYNLNKSMIGDNPNSIKPGMKLKMPDGSIYRVQPGDSLSKIAAGQINELSTNKLAQYKTAAAKDAKEADKAGDFERGNKRFHGIVQATKKQFDNDAKKVDESRAARRALMARIVNS